MTNIIAIANHKGGAGKTTSAFYLARCLADRGRNVLVVDLDDQATLTARYQRDASRGASIADALDGSADMADTLCQAVTPSFSTLHYVPADHRLSWQAARMQAASPNHMFLAKALRPMLHRYHDVVLDCPPSAGIIMINALAVATHIIIPVTASEESHAGRLRMETMVEEIGGLLNHEILRLGVIITMRVARSNSQAHWEAQHGASVLGVVPHAVGVDADERIHTAYDRIAADELLQAGVLC